MYAITAFIITLEIPKEYETEMVYWKKKIKMKKWTGIPWICYIQVA